MAEWLKATVLKTVVSLAVPRVRIPVFPPFFYSGKVPEWSNGLPC